MSTPRQHQGGLSVTTLAIASAASVAAAIVVHEVWRGGAILGAALTPVIVAIVSESLRRPVDRVTSIREERRTRTEVRTGRASGREVLPPPPELERPDPFGIWQEPPAGRKIQPRHLKIALVTGLAAFAIGAIVLTGAELVFGGNVGGGGDRVTIVPSGGGKSDDKKQSTTETEPEEEAPATTETAPPATTEPPTTTEPAPGTTEPAPPTTEPAPAPETPPPTPAPTTPEPVPPGQ